MRVSDITTHNVAKFFLKLSRRHILHCLILMPPRHYEAFTTLMIVYLKRIVMLMVNVYAQMLVLMPNLNQYGWITDSCSS